MRTEVHSSTPDPSLGTYIVLQPAGQQTAQQKLAHEHVHRGEMLTLARNSVKGFDWTDSTGRFGKHNGCRAQWLSGAMALDSYPAEP
jgi:hypothetical protein